MTPNRRTTMLNSVVIADARGRATTQTGQHRVVVANASADLVASEPYGAGRPAIAIFVLAADALGRAG